MGHDPADGLHGQAQVVGDVVPRHGQVELRGGKAAAFETARQVQQKSRHAGLGGFARQCQHHGVFAHDLIAHQGQEVIVEAGQIPTQIVQAVEGQFTHTGLLQGDGRAGMVAVADPIETEQLPGHVEADNLLFPARGGQVGFDRAGAHRVQGGKRLPQFE